MFDPKSRTAAYQEANRLRGELAAVEHRIALGGKVDEFSCVLWGLNSQERAAIFARLSAGFDVKTGEPLATTATEGHAKRSAIRRRPQ